MVGSNIGCEKIIDFHPGKGMCKKNENSSSLNKSVHVSDEILVFNTG